MTALRYYATASVLSVCGDVHGLSKTSASRTTHSVSAALCRHVSTFIQFPRDREQLTKMKVNFYDIARFQNVIGSIDGTLVPIKAPHVDEHLFQGQVIYHALNVQIVNDANLTITNIIAKWAGSTHDSHVWNMCALKDNFGHGVYDGWLLGDSSYACTPWMVTTILNPQTAKKVTYNTILRKTRNTSEKTIGVFKMRFRCLHKSGGCLLFSPKRCVKIIMATAILHNICNEHGLPIDEPELEEGEDDNNHAILEIHRQQNNTGNTARNNLIERKL